MSSESLAAAFGTPLYVYDLARVRGSVAALRAALPAASTLYYSLKANRHPAVLETLHTAGCQAEVSSQGEVEAALHAGFDMARCIFTEPGKSESDIAHALKSGVRLFSADSPVDLDRLESVAAGAGKTVEVLLRLNVDAPVAGIGLKMTGVATQMGADVSWVLRDPGTFLGRRHVDVSGLHLYMGTNLGNEDLLMQQFEASMAAAIAVSRRLGVPLRKLDLGGGFGAPYAALGARPSFPALRCRLDALLARSTLSKAEDFELIFESGRHLAADCGTFISRVLDVKISKGERFVVLDSGMQHFSGLASLRRVPHSPPQLDDASRAGRPIVRQTLTGHLCTPLDIWARHVDQPELRVGDLVTVPNVGAYGLAASLVHFHGHPLPVEVAVDGEIMSASRLTISRHVEASAFAARVVEVLATAA